MLDKVFFLIVFVILSVPLAIGTVEIIERSGLIESESQPTSTYECSLRYAEWASMMEHTPYTFIEYLEIVEANRENW